MRAPGRCRVGVVDSCAVASRLLYASWSFTDFYDPILWKATKLRSNERSVVPCGASARSSAELEKIDAAELTADEWLLVRAQVGNLVADFNGSVAEVDRLLDTTGAQARILRYLRLRLGEKVSKDELSGVAGIYEWARRVRELRQDHGWAIHSSVTRDDLHVGEYRLESEGPNPDLSRDWATARRIRKLRTSGGVLPPRTHVSEFLKAIHPRAADKEQLAHVAGSATQTKSEGEVCASASGAVVGETA